VFDLPRERNMIDGLGVDRAAQQDRDAQRYFEGLIFESLLEEHRVPQPSRRHLYIPEKQLPAPSA
jgi:hypothetical protein